VGEVAQVAAIRMSDRAASGRRRVLILSIYYDPEPFPKAA